MDEKQIIETLKDWSDALSIQSFANDAIRNILWKIAKGLGSILDMVGKTVEKIYSLMGFVNYSGLEKYMKNLQPLVFLLLIISIAFFGFYLLTRKSTAQINVFQSLIAIILIITVMPILSMKIGSFSKQASKYARENYTSGGSTFAQIVDSNIIDLKKIDAAEGDIPKFKAISKDIAKKGNNISGVKSISSLKINEYMNYSDDDFKHGDLWENALTTDANGKDSLTKMSKGHVLDVLKDYYYRYHVNWGTMLFSILAMAIALLFTALKSARIIFEIGFHQILGPFVAVSDLATGQRIKEFIRSLLSLFAALFLIAALMGVYFIGIDYLNSKNLNSFTMVICELALAWMVIDGPNVVERIIGIDIGLKNAHGMLVGMWASGRTASGVAKGTYHSAKNTAKAAGKAKDRLQSMAKAAAGKNSAGKTESVANNAAKAKSKTAFGRTSSGHGAAEAVKNGVNAAKEKASKDSAESLESLNEGAKRSKAASAAKNASSEATASSKAGAKAGAKGTAKSAAAKKSGAVGIANAAASAAKKNGGKQNMPNASGITPASKKGIANAAKGGASGASNHLEDLDKRNKVTKNSSSPSSSGSQAARKDTHSIGSGIQPENTKSNNIASGAQNSSMTGSISASSYQSPSASSLAKGQSSSISNQAGNAAHSGNTPAPVSGNNSGTVLLNGKPVRSKKTNSPEITRNPKKGGKR